MDFRTFMLPSIVIQSSSRRIYEVQGCWAQVEKFGELDLMPNSVMDRGCLDYQRLYGIHQPSAFFVTRTKRNSQLRCRKSNPVERATGVRVDHVVVLTGPIVSKEYPAVLRRIRYVDQDTGKRRSFLTNNSSPSALSIALLYKMSWQVELFFKWIEQ